MRIDRPVRRRRQTRREPVVGVVVDAQVQVEPAGRDLVPLIALKMDDIDELGQRATAVDTGRIGPEAIIEDQGDAVDAHGSKSNR